MESWEAVGLVNEKFSHPSHAAGWMTAGWDGMPAG
jgi:hypothetical protein